MNDYELYHHGVKGQKWGVRRTAAQLGHLAARKIAKAASATGKATAKQAGKAKKAIVAKAKQDVKNQKEANYYKRLKRKSLSDMTDKEITDLTARIKKEASLKDAKYESRVQNARKFYKTVAQQPVNSFANTFGVNVAKKLTGQELNKGDSKKKNDD